MVAAPSGEVGDGVGECVSDEVELVGTEAGGVQVVEGVKVDMGHGFLWGGLHSVQKTGQIP